MNKDIATQEYVSCDHQCDKCRAYRLCWTPTQKDYETLADKLLSLYD